MEKSSKKETKVQQYWHMLGPGLTTGAADDDPSGIATYSQAGAAFGYGFLWTALFTFPFMAVVQEMCARIGIVTGRGLASAIRKHYSKKILYVAAFLLLIANTFNLGADLGIMAKAVELLYPSLNFIFLLLFFTAVSLILQIYTTYAEYARILKWVALVLFSYVLSAFIVHVDWGQALHSTFIPSLRFDKQTWIILTAVLGTTISPYLFFWQTSQEVEEQILEGKKTLHQREAVTTPPDIRKMRVDVWSGMFLSNLVMFFIIAVCAVTLHAHGILTVTSATEAALALKPLAGNFAFLLFTLGIIGTGLLGIPVLAGSSSYAISECFGWREGLYRQYKQAHSFYGVIILSMIVGLFMNFLHLDIIKMLIYSALINGIVSPFILAIIVLLSSNKKVMKEWVNHPMITFIGWVVTVFMALASVTTIWFLFRS